MIEIRIHGRGGQGAVIAADILATALVMEGKYAASFPFFGVERRGAPVTAYVRFDTVPIRERTRVYNPDIIIIMDKALSANPDCYDGLKSGSTAIINSLNAHIDPAISRKLNFLAAVDATAIAYEETGKAITNTCILGAFAKVTQVVSLECLNQAITEFFNQKVLAMNLRLIERGYNEVNLQDLSIHQSLANESIPQVIKSIRGDQSGN